MAENKNNPNTFYNKHIRNFFDFSGALKDPEWLGTKVRPMLSMRTTRVLTGILGTAAVYISLVSEYDDQGSTRISVTTDTLISCIPMQLRNYHDRMFKEYLDIDIREKIRNFERKFRSGFVTSSSPVTKMSEEEINKLSAEEQFSIRKEIERKKNQELQEQEQIRKDQQYQQKKPVFKVYSSEEERIDSIIKKSTNDTNLLADVVNKEFERLNLQNNDKSKNIIHSTSTSNLK
ncbi:putative WRKY transcription factor [Tieghemostelium lacteum]|uniref:Putative WRKY transcription factor n=1 Tax=Tieghemostelium lacteum TaxID=361077 RepID=A0A151Z9U5_TIELA|nr:putative WRKY transcription factor [Tieghemostelium lacteum]|eukprot:KYQ90720.1 putative WRKY transcription factor [Tieghemostelium lacteum]